MYSKAKLKAISLEEAKTSREYAKHGFKSFAKDEARHSAFFKMLSKQKGR